MSIEYWELSSEWGLMKILYLISGYPLAAFSGHSCIFLFNWIFYCLVEGWIGFRTFFINLDLFFWNLPLCSYFLKMVSSDGVVIAGLVLEIISFSALPSRLLLRSKSGGKRFWIRLRKFEVFFFRPVAALGDHSSNFFSFSWIFCCLVEGCWKFCPFLWRKRF